jgi:hypothetical protein
MPPMSLPPNATRCCPMRVPSGGNTQQAACAPSGASGSSDGAAHVQPKRSAAADSPPAARRQPPPAARRQPPSLPAGEALTHVQLPRPLPTAADCAAHELLMNQVDQDMGLPHGSLALALGGPSPTQPL